MWVWEHGRVRVGRDRTRPTETRTTLFDLGLGLWTDSTT